MTQDEMSKEEVMKELELYKARLERLKEEQAQIVRDFFERQKRDPIQG